MSGNQDPGTTSTQLTRATWLLGLIAKWMVLHPDGTARVELPAGMVESIREFVAEQAPKL